MKFVNLLPSSSRGIWWYPSRKGVCKCFVCVLQDACDEIEGHPGVMGFLEVRLIELLKIHRSAWLPVLLGHYHHALAPLSRFPSRHLFNYVPADVSVEHLVVEIIWHSRGYVYSVWACVGLEVDVVRGTTYLCQGWALHCKHHTPKMFQEPPLEAIHVFLYQLVGKCGWTGGGPWSSPLSVALTRGVGSLAKLTAGLCRLPAIGTYAALPLRCIHSPGWCLFPPSLGTVGSLGASLLRVRGWRSWVKAEAVAGGPPGPSEGGAQRCTLALPCLSRWSCLWSVWWDDTICI